MVSVGAGHVSASVQVAEFWSTIGVQAFSSVLSVLLASSMEPSSWVMAVGVSVTGISAFTSLPPWSTRWLFLNWASWGFWHVWSPPVGVVVVGAGDHSVSLSSAEHFSSSWTVADSSSVFILLAGHVETVTVGTDLETIWGSNASSASCEPWEVSLIDSWGTTSSWWISWLWARSWNINSRLLSWSSSVPPILVVSVGAGHESVSDSAEIWTATI